jgi:hypothetical protein
VNDYNQQPESFAPRREWLSQLVAPHVNFAARLSTPGGHGADWADEATTITVNTPRAARYSVEQVLKYKPDLIKVFADGWRYGTAPDNTSMDEGTLRALTDEAHKHNLKVVTHTVTVDKGEVESRAGVDSSPMPYRTARSRPTRSHCSRRTAPAWCRPWRSILPTSLATP